MRGRLEQRYLQTHPGATTGLELCRWFEAHPNRWFTHAEIKRALGCSDRIIREHVPEAVNDIGMLLEVDKSGRAWRYRYLRDA
jgi:hypothetical protein